MTRVTAKTIGAASLFDHTDFTLVIEVANAEQQGRMVVVPYNSLTTSL